MMAPATNMVAPATIMAPATMMATDCAHSIFWFLELHELMIANQVCTQWRAQTLSLPVCPGTKRHVRIGTHRQMFLFMRSPWHKKINGVILHGMMDAYDVFGWNLPLAICTLLTTNARITYLRLSYEYNKIDIITYIHVMNVIFCKSHLTHVDLAMCRFEDMQMDALVNAIKRNMRLTHLSITNSGLNSSDVSKLAHVLAAHKTICSVDFSGNGDIDNNGAVALAAAVEQNHNLTDVDLFLAKRISHEGISSIAAAIKKNHSMQRLNVGLCQVDDNGCNALVQALKLHPSMTFLSLHRAGIFDMSVFTSLFMHTKLIDVRLGGNDTMNVANCAAFASVLAHNQSIRYLDLSSTNMKDDGLIVFAPCIITNTSLEFLSLNNNTFTRKGIAPLVAAMSLNRKHIRVSIHYAVVGHTEFIHSLAKPVALFF